MATATRVFVLLFNAGTENEGIHTIRIGDRNLVLMFEEEDDATRYALLLEAQDFPVPAVEAIAQEEIESFCRSVGYDCKLVPAGFIPENETDRLFIAPPEINLEQTEWQTGREAVPDAEESTMSDSELDRIRRQLEGLL
jgi:hypothetical protein